MMSPEKYNYLLTLIPLWQEAIAQEFGLAVRSDNAGRLITFMYQARNEAKLPILRELSLSVCPDDPSIVWIYHTGKQSPEITVDAPSF